MVGSACVSVQSHLTSGASVRPENTVTYLAGNGGKKFAGFSLKLLSCRNMYNWPFSCGKHACALLASERAHLVVKLVRFFYIYIYICM